MRSVVHAAEATAVDMRVDLRRRQRAVPEQFLDRTEVGAPLQQMGGEGMAHPVWMGQQPPQGARVETTPANGQEERVLCTFRQVGTSLM